MDQTALTTKSQNQDVLANLRAKIYQSEIPEDLSERLTTKLSRLEKMISTSGYKAEFDKEIDYLDFVSSLPFKHSSVDILDLQRAKAILDKNHFGLEKVKERILEYLAMLILNSHQNRVFHSTVLAFVGLVGSGKTSLAYSIAQSLSRQIIRIPFGGLGSVKELRGESRVNPAAEPGFLMRSIKNLGVNNPVVLLDELDRVSVESRSDVMGVLVELLDPEQNSAFVDRFVDYPFDLSKVLFIATANNLSNVATAVLDRLEIIEMPSYSDQEKITIGRDYVLPKAIQAAGLSLQTILIDSSVWPQIVRPLGYDAGIRSLQRTIQGIVGKVAKEVVEGNSGPYNLNLANIGQYLPGVGE